MSIRIEKINKLVKSNINDIFTRDLNFKSGVFITISKVDTSPDLRYTRVFISVFPEKETPYVAKALQKELGKIQGRLNRLLHMKPLPKIEFRMDDTEVRADEIEKILKQI